MILSRLNYAARTFSVLIMPMAVLPGCALPLVMGANLAASEVATTAMQPKVEVKGTDLYQMADWTKRFDKKTASMGNNQWSCARGGPATTVCVPKNEATEANVKANVIFKCAYGSGGMMTQMISSDAGILFCRKA
jgi:hypothetical protein